MTPPRASDARRAQLEALAQEIVDDLFVNGAGQQADRLVLTTRVVTHDLGGWGKGPMRDRILDALLRADASPPAALPAETPRAETCATCRHWDNSPDANDAYCALPKSPMEFLAAPGDFYCNLHEPVEGAAEPLAHIDHAQDGSAE